MSERNHFDILVLGAGIAGLSIAFAACKTGFKVAVADIRRPGSGASGVPQALLNPATGRRAKKAWNAEICLGYTRSILEEVQKETDGHFYSNNGVIRPALDNSLAEDMYRSYRKTRWPEGWVEWLDESELKKRFPGLSCIGGGLWVPAGGTVSLNSFINAFYQYLNRRGMRFYLEPELSVAGSKPWLLSGRSSAISSDIIIHAKGEAITRDARWSMLPLHRVKGQVLTLELKKKLPFRCSVSSLGYIAQGGDSSGSIVLGSTYEHHFDHSGPDEKGAAYLFKRLGQTVAEVEKMVTKSEGWAGIRVTTPDKKPFAGKHPEIDNLYAVGGLGSKGLMLGPYLGKLLIDSIKNESKIPEILNLNRMLN